MAWWHEQGEDISWMMNLAEPPLVFDRKLTDDERQQIYQYYADKYGLSFQGVTVDVDHQSHR